LLCGSALATTTNCTRSSSPSSTFTGIVIGDFTNQCAGSGTANCAARARTGARLLRRLLLCLSLLLIRLFLLCQVERIRPCIADRPFVARRLILNTSIVAPNDWPCAYAATGTAMAIRVMNIFFIVFSPVSLAYS
jgi:hypothetical protein